MIIHIIHCCLAILSPIGFTLGLISKIREWATTVDWLIDKIGGNQCSSKYPKGNAFRYSANINQKRFYWLPITHASNF
jgi:hypothetical protein